MLTKTRTAETQAKIPGSYIKERITYFLRSIQCYFSTWFWTHALSIFTIRRVYLVPISNCVPYSFPVLKHLWYCFRTWKCFIGKYILHLAGYFIFKGYNEACHMQLIIYIYIYLFSAIFCFNALVHHFVANSILFLKIPGRFSWFYLWKALRRLQAGSIKCLIYQKAKGYSVRSIPQNWDII